MVKDANCKNKTYRDFKTEEIIYTEIRKLKTDPSYFKEIRKLWTTRHAQKMIEKRIEQIESQVSKLTDLYTLGSIRYNLIKAKMNSF